MGNSPTTVAEALLLRLGRAGVPYLFANSGTDAAPLIEAYARLAAEGSGRHQSQWWSRTRWRP